MATAGAKAVFESTRSPMLLVTQAFTRASPGETVSERVGRQASASETVWRCEVAEVMNQPYRASSPRGSLEKYSVSYSLSAPASTS